MNHERIKALQETIKRGARVRVLEMNDESNPVPSGTCGSVFCVDDQGTVHVDWDNGSSLGLIEGDDSWVLLP